MCGILGTMPAYDQNLFLSALNRLAHRGPDGYGLWYGQEGDLTLGHRRLSILDLSEKGKQPLVYNRYVITYNGEVYNFTEIREELVKKGHRFVSDTDTEVVVAAYMEWGTDCLIKFNGMWAFGIWDQKKKELFLSRDRFGIKPLFYAIIGDRLVFASEMKAIFPFLRQLMVSDDFKFCQNNLFDYETTDKCLIAGIKRFPAGHYAVIDSREPHILKPVRWWNTLETIYDVPENYELQTERFRELFFDSVKLRMRSDVKVGTALSGGVDSSAVICAMANIHRAGDNRVSKHWQNAFCASFPNTSIDETVLAKQVVNHLGIKGVFEEIDPINGIENLNDYLWQFEELYPTSPIPMMDIYKTIKNNGVSVSLDGHGADELFSGYGTSIFDAVLDTPLDITRIQNIVNTYVSNTAPVEKHYGFVARMKHYGKAYKNVLVRYRDLITTNRRLNAETRNTPLGYYNQYLYNEFHKKVLPTLLRNYDRYSMSAGVEVRMPFMDHRLVSYCFSLPWHSKLHGGYTKSILRQAMDPFVPKDVLWRKQKIGFTTPFAEWMLGPWKSYLLDTIHSKDFLQSQLVEPQLITNKVKAFYHKNKMDHLQAKQIWKMLTPHLWERAILTSNKQLAKS